MRKWGSTRDGAKRAINSLPAPRACKRRKITHGNSPLNRGRKVSSSHLDDRPAVGVRTGACGPQKGVLMTEIPGWHITGDWFDNCSCAVACPCTFAQAPDNGACESVLF